MSQASAFKAPEGAARYLAAYRPNRTGRHVFRWMVSPTYAVAAPGRVRKLVLLSAGGFLPIAREFSLRGMLMLFFPTRFTVNAFMRWAGFTDVPGERDARPVLNLMYWA